MKAVGHLVVIRVADAARRLRRRERFGGELRQHFEEILGDEANKPLVVRLDGNNVEEGRRILAEANHPLVTLVPTMDEAADKAAELANA